MRWDLFSRPLFSRFQPNVSRDQFVSPWILIKHSIIQGSFWCGCILTVKKLVLVRVLIVNHWGHYGKTKVSEKIRSLSLFKGVIDKWQELWYYKLFLLNCISCPNTIHSWLIIKLGENFSRIRVLLTGVARVDGDCATWILTIFGFRSRLKNFASKNFQIVFQTKHDG